MERPPYIADYYLAEFLKHTVLVTSQKQLDELLAVKEDFVLFTYNSYIYD
jgi:hypothetical protein